MKELEYAIFRKKPLVPVNLWENDKEQKGAAWFHCAQLIWVDFRDIERDCQAEDIPFSHHPLWDDKVQSLKKVIRALISDSTTGQAGVGEIQQIVGPAYMADLKRWLNPVDFTGDREQYAKSYVGETRLWAIRDIVVRLRNENQPVVWLEAGAGMGKSMVAWLLTTMLPSDEFKLASQFYCRHNDVTKNNAASLVRTIIWDLANTFADELSSFFNAAMDEDRERKSRNEESILKQPIWAFQKLVVEALWKIAPPAKTYVFVIDALDECGKQGDAERNKFLDVLRRMKTANVTAGIGGEQVPVALPTWVRIFTTGRPEQDIWDSLVTLRCAKLEARKSDNIRDVRKFIEARLRDAVPFDVESPVIDAISEKSGGVFVYAHDRLWKTLLSKIC